MQISLAYSIVNFHKQISHFTKYLFFSGENWNGVLLDEFARCTSNLAINRQTRMLSDLALVGCYNQTAMSAHDRDSIMLASAKRNIAAMSYFGLTEFQKVIIHQIFEFFLTLYNFLIACLDITICI